MKKLMFALAAVTAGVISAQAIESSVVGYAGRGAPEASFRLAGLPFVGCANESVNINDILNYPTTVENFDDGAFMLTAPQIQIQKADGGYTTYYRITNAMYSKDPTDENADIDYKPGWVDYQGILADPAHMEAGYCSADGVCPVTHGMWTQGVSKTFTMTYKPPFAK